MILLPPNVAVAHQCIHHAGCALLCCFIVITAPVVYLIHSVVLEVEWGHVGSFTGISGEWFGCSLTAALTPIREGGRIFLFFFFLLHNASDANSSISATRYTETLLGSSPCNHGNRRILLVGSGQWWGTSRSASSNSWATCSPAHRGQTLMGQCRQGLEM